MDSLTFADCEMASLSPRLAVAAGDQMSESTLCSLPPRPALKRPRRIATLKAAQMRQLIKEAALVLPHLKRGDMVVRCLNPISLSNSWSLVRAEILVSDGMVELLKSADSQMPRKLRSAVGRGVLRPHEDGLPGFGHSQTWAWVMARRITA
jgi:hypothetical protein